VKTVKNGKYLKSDKDDIIITDLVRNYLIVNC
jgi:hypothetical protein